MLAAYLKYWDEQVEAYATGSIKGTDLKKYAVGSALGHAKSGVASMKKGGTRTTGTPSHDAEVTRLEQGAEGKLPTATVTDCLDISKWETVEKKTGKVQPFPSEQPLQYVLKVEAEKWGKQWKMLRVDPTGKAC